QEDGGGARRGETARAGRGGVAAAREPRGEREEQEREQRALVVESDAVPDEGHVEERAGCADQGGGRRGEGEGEERRTDLREVLEAREPEQVARDAAPEPLGLG